MKKIADLYRDSKFPYATIIITAMCLIVTIPTFLNPKLFDILAMSTKPAHFWQYATGIFEHVPMPQAWMALVHLGMNLLGLIPFGILLEKRLGSKAVWAIFFSEWLTSAVLFQLVNIGREATAAGISTVCFAFAVPANAMLVKLWKQEGCKYWRQPLSWFFAFETLGMLSLLVPQGSMTSMWLHVSGVAVGFAAACILKKKISLVVRSTQTQEKDDEMSA